MPDPIVSPSATNNSVSPHQQKFDGLISRVKDLYGTKNYNRAPEVEKKLQERFGEFVKKGDDKKTDDFLDLVEGVFNQRQEAIDERKRVISQLVKIDEIVTNPETVSVKDWMSQGRLDTAALTTEQIKKLEKPITHLKAPSLEYRNNVMLAGLETQDFLEMNLARLNNVMEHGIDITGEEKKRLNNLRSVSNHPRSKEKIARAASVIHKIMDQAGKGIYSQTDAVDLNYTKNYHELKEALAATLRSKISSRRTDYSQLMEKLLGKINSSDNLLDLASLNSVKEMIDTEIKKDDDEHQKRVDKLDKDLKDLEKKMLDDMQKHTDKSDDMWKYRMLSVFLVFTPLGAFSIAGHVFNYLDPLAEIFGPIFDAHKSFGQGIGDAITSKKFGIFGEMMDKMEIDKAVEGAFDKLPILSQFSDLWGTIVHSDIAQNLMVEASPIMDSPLLLGAIGVGYTLSRAPEELKHNKDVNAAKTKHTKALEDAFKAIYTDMDKGWKDGAIDNPGREVRLKNYVKTKYTNLEKANIDVKMSEFFIKHAYDPTCEDLFKEAFPKLFDHFKAGKFHDERTDNVDDVPTASKMLEFLNGDKTTKADLEKEKAEARDKFLLLAGLDGQIIKNGEISQDPDQLLLKFKDAVKNTALDKANRDHAQEMFNNNFYFEIAKQEHISHTPDKKGAQTIRTRIEEMDAKKLLDDLRHSNLTPNSVTAPIEVRDLHRNPVFPPSQNPSSISFRV